MFRRLFERLFRHTHESALTRRAWYLAGRRDERHHAKQRTTFPALPD